MTKQERRSGVDRRSGDDRRKVQDLGYTGSERRSGIDRRSGEDRRISKTNTSSKTENTHNEDVKPQSLLYRIKKIISNIFKKNQDPNS